MKIKELPRMVANNDRYEPLHQWCSNSNPQDHFIQPMGLPMGPEILQQESCGSVNYVALEAMATNASTTHLLPKFPDMWGVLKAGWHKARCWIELVCRVWPQLDSAYRARLASGVWIWCRVLYWCTTHSCKLTPCWIQPTDQPQSTHPAHRARKLSTTALNFSGRTNNIKCPFRARLF